MKVLFICSEPPCPENGGGAQRLYHQLRTLVLRHQVTLAFKGRLDRQELYRSCCRVVPLSIGSRRYHLHRVGLPAQRRARDLVSSVRPALVEEWLSADFIGQLRGLHLLGPFDAVWVERAYLASAARAAGLVADVVDVDDIDSDAFAQRLTHLGPSLSRPIDWAEWIKIRVYEFGLSFRHAALLVCKEQDRRVFANRARVHVVPNGTTIPASYQRAIMPVADFVFVGNLSYWPNIDAVTWFVGEVLPLVRKRRPRATFMAVGRWGKDVAQRLGAVPGCTVITDPAEVGPFYRQSRVAVVPMRHGSGTCIKTLEALAFACPLVVTPRGAEGHALVNNYHARIASAPQEFADACIKLLDDSDAASQLGETGRQHVAKNYSWDTCAAKAVDVLERTVSAYSP